MKKTKITYQEAHRRLKAKMAPVLGRKPVERAEKRPAPSSEKR